MGSALYYKEKKKKFITNRHNVQKLENLLNILVNIFVLIYFSKHEQINT